MPTITSSKTITKLISIYYEKASYIVNNDTKQAGHLRHKYAYMITECRRIEGWCEHIVHVEPEFDELMFGIKLYPTPAPASVTAALINGNSFNSLPLIHDDMLWVPYPSDGAYAQLRLSYMRETWEDRARRTWDG